MTREEAPWQLVALSDEGLALTVTRACTAGELAQELLPSKAVVSRVFSRSQLRRAGQLLSREAVLAPGDAVKLSFHREKVLSGKEGPLELIYQDPLLLVVDKPADLLIHGDGTVAATLTDRVQAHLAQQGSPAKPQAIQRLDRETTGLVVFSLTEEFQPALDVQVAGHDMHKRYLAIVMGRLETGDAWRTIDVPVGRDRHDARRMRVSATGKPSMTRVRTLATSKGRTLVLAELATGRRHQIRVHLSHIGHPIWGDALYGAKRNQGPLMLHAWQEQLVHPVTGELLRFETSVPERLTQVFPQVSRTGNARS